MNSFSFNKIPRNLEAKRIKGPRRALKAQQPIVTGAQFKVKDDLFKNDVHITNKLLTPTKSSLPASGQPGQIVFDAATGKFYGWNGSTWAAFDTRETNERVFLSDSTEINPDVNNTFLQGTPGVVKWCGRFSSDDNKYIQNNNINAAVLNNLDDTVLPIYYNNSSAQVYNGDGTLAFTLGSENSQVFVRYSSAGAAELCGRVAQADVRAFGLNDNNSAVFAGNFSSVMSIYNGDNNLVKTLPPESGVDCFILKYNSNNDLDWTSKLSSASNDTLNGCAINNAEKVIVSGLFSGNTLKIYNANSTTSYTILNNNTGANMLFLSKYGSNGNVEWATRISSNFTFLNYGSSNINDNDVSVVNLKSSNSTIVAYHASGVPALTLSANGFAGLTGVFNYSPGGTLNWGAAIRSKADVSLNSLRLDSSNNLVVAGTYQTTVVYFYNSNDSLGVSLQNPLSSDAFVTKYNSSGFVQWAARISGNSGIYYTVADTNDLGNVVVTGNYNNSPLYIYNSSNVLVSSLQQSGSGDIFIVNYDSNGDFISAAKIGGTYAEDYSMVGINNLSNVIVAGTYKSSPLSLYNSDSVIKLTLPIKDSDYNDIFIAKYSTAAFLGNPVRDETVKTIVYNGPTSALINTAASIEGISQIIQLDPYDTVKMLWDAVESKWIVLLNEGNLL